MYYPANFWLHKNHEILMIAYSMFVSRNPDCTMDLVLTGALDDAQRGLEDHVRRMGLESRVHFLGYLSEEQLSAVWEGCSFLIFPSLYEGFGIPVLEAMQFGKPVLCSHVTSLPEVAGDAALYFDPEKPRDIVRCIEKIVENKELYADLVRRGYERLDHFQPKDMAAKYLQCLCDVIGSSGRLRKDR
jgi:glycosyltransferase involved in cell wall biosynthesis